MKRHLFALLACVVACSAQFNDDMQVYEKECLGEDRFHCFDGGCISREQQCDGNVDCSDGSDENFCLNHTPDPYLCNQTHQYLCEDGLKCIQATWVCNNIMECDDGSDEVNCTEPLPPPTNSSCKGFLCGDGTCISRTWVCDAHYDCIDRTDEDTENCRHSAYMGRGDVDCEDRVSLVSDYIRLYSCTDGLHCLNKNSMCDGMQDCRDGSDEGPFCKQWPTMCSNVTCGDSAVCLETREGPLCFCKDFMFSTYNNVTNKCEPRNMCIEPAPVCSQICHDKGGPHYCFCEPGYRVDILNVAHMCYAPDPEGMLFFSTRNEIKYLYLKSKQIFTIASGIKEAHGVSYDGTFVYWVETAMGHQSIVRAHLEKVAETKQILVSLGLEDAGDVAVDWMGGHIYFSDAERGVISVCLTDGSMCTTLRTNTRAPKHVTLDPKTGKMYWADWHGKPVIMTAQMDGSEPEVLVEHLHKFPTGLALDAPGGRLYYVDKTIKGVLIENKRTFAVLHETVHQPNSLTVFENSLYWSDWSSNTIQISNKIHRAPEVHAEPYKLDAPVFGLHIYHPILINKTSNPCSNHNCSHFCLIKSNISHTCACPEGMKIVNTTCQLVEGYKPQYLIVAGGSKFTRIQYNALGNPETHATHFDVLRVHAMAYDNSRDTLYIYDGRRKSINYVNMSEFSLGVTQTLTYQGLKDVVDMGYDYISDALYVLDAGRRVLEVFSLRTFKRSIIYRFDQEIPISMVVLPNYGKILIALKTEDGLISIDSFGMEGHPEHRHVVWNNLKGPRVRLQYSHEMDNVYFSDEGNRVIEHIHVKGTGREIFRELSTTIASLAVTDTYVFWTDRRATRLYWSEIHETTPKIRRLEFSMFPNDTHLHLLATTPIPDPKSIDHPCRTQPVCSDICVQSSPFLNMRTYVCLCPPGMLNVDGICVGLRKCEESQGYCHLSNTCFDEKERCDGKKDCLHGEDEEGCTTVKPSTTTFSPDSCPPNEIICHGVCIDHNQICTPEKPVNLCSDIQFECVTDQLCIPRWQMCDRKNDCPDGSDEALALCHTHNCLQSEFMCSSGTCIFNTFRCDGELDCPDGSDEVNCATTVCTAGFYTCSNNQCIEVHKRCDSKTDCTDGSDEEACDDPDDASNQEEIENCAEWEYACELNRSICIPLTARCNQKAECPGGTDEVGCIGPCSQPRWLCDDYRCLRESKICDGNEDCADRSDETPGACKIANRTSHFYPPIIYPREECHDGYLCKNGLCIDWKRVCDDTPDCYDGSDEHGRCNISCLHHKCSDRCQPSPNGPICQCREGYHIDTDHQTCVDTDECEKDACAQACYNVPGSYLCSCHRGYALRSDRHSCKATKGHMLVYYVTGNSVKSKAAGGFTTVEYNNAEVGRISDMDVDVRRNMLYLTSEEAGRLIQVNSSRHDTTITNVGLPSKVSVDWITGNIYFADSTPAEPRIRVCNFGSKRCASLQKLTSGSVVSSLIVDPASRRMFYCVTKDLESVVWSATLSGQKVIDITTVHNCTGLAVDSFRKKLYVAETGPAHILQMGYEGDKYKKILTNDRHLESPQGLAIFEDHIYYLVANSFELNRCLLYGSKECEPYLRRIFDANTFVLRHESVQRDDLKNVCDGFNCTHVCVLDETGPTCVCDNGTLAKDGNCPLVEKIQLPLFDGRTFQESINAENASSSTFVIVCSVMGLFAVYLGVFLYYHYVHRHRQARKRPYLPVLFSRSSASAGSSTQGLSPLTTPSVQMLENIDEEKNEYTNPFEFLRNAWRQSFLKDPRPVGTSGLTIEVPSKQTPSDTESDLDERELKSSTA